MKVSVNVEYLDAALKLAGHAVAKKSHLPALLNVVMRTVNSELEVVTSDLVVTSKLRMPASVKASGEISVPYASLAALTSKLPASEHITFTFEKGALSVKCGRSTYKLPTLPSNEFPQLPRRPDDTGHTVPAFDLRRGLEAVEHAMSPDVTRPHISCVQYSATKSSVSLMATDATRAAVATFPVPETRAFKCVIPGRGAKALAKLAASCGDDESVSICADSTRAWFWSQSAEFCVVLQNVVAPDLSPFYGRIQGNGYLADRAQILAVLGRLHVLGHGGVHLEAAEAKPTEIELRLEEQASGQGRELIDVEAEAKHSGFSVWVQGTLLADAVDACVTKRIRIAAGPSEHDPIYVAHHHGDETSKDEKPFNLTCVVMPSRIIGA